MPAEPSETRIAHLTDPHLPFGLPSGVEWLGKRGLSGLSWLVRRHKRHCPQVAEALVQDMLAHPHDLVAMTGDLINFGLPREFEASRRWLTGLGPPERVIALPGNHEALAGDWGKAMQRHWGDYARPGRVITHGGTALISVSSACVTPPFFASGVVAKDALEMLRHELDAARDRGLLPVVLIHHPPTPITIRRKALANLQETADVIARGGASLVLHGHTHSRDLSWISAPHGRIPVLGAPSLSMSAGHRQAPGAWRSLRIRPGTGQASLCVTERTITASLQISTRTPVEIALPVLA